MERTNRRTKKEIENTIENALETLLPKHGFSSLQLTNLVEEASIDHNVFYRNFGTIDDLYDTFINKYNFWLNEKINIADLQKLGDRKFFINMLHTLYNELETNETVQQIIVWELEDKSPITRKAAALRETLNMSLVSYYERVFKGSGIDITALTTVFSAAIYYIVLHRKISTFNTIDCNTTVGKKKILDLITFITNIIFDKLEQRKRDAEIMKKMAADNIEIASIAKYFGLIPSAVQKIIEG